jgi:hypothetical protein
MAIPTAFVGALREIPEPVLEAMRPVFDRAAALTDMTLAADDAWPIANGAPPGSISSVDRPQSDGPVPPVAGPTPAQVNNNFSVTVAMGASRDDALDREALQDALVAILRDAARRQGLDV